jgi:hypothetical protein
MAATSSKSNTAVLRVKAIRLGSFFISRKGGENMGHELIMEFNDNIVHMGHYYDDLQDVKSDYSNEEFIWWWKGSEIHIRPLTPEEKQKVKLAKKLRTICKG